MNEASIAISPFVNDQHFDNLYSDRMQELSTKHWTPVQVATYAADFLAEQPGSKILDIGSGIGKFCLVAGQNQPGSHFYGVEKRRDLINVSDRAKRLIGIENVTFIHANFTQIDLNKFDHFYFYNSFYENLVEEEYHIDESIDYSLSLYEYYTHYLFKALENKPSGTKLSTYHGFREVVPLGYRLFDSVHNSLRCWIKE